MPLLVNHIPKLIQNSGCLMGKAMNVPTAIMLTESHTHTHTHICLLQIQTSLLRVVVTLTHRLWHFSQSPCGEHHCAVTYYYVIFIKIIPFQASLLKSPTVELTDNSVTVASYLEDGIQYDQNGYCGHNSVLKSSTDKDSSLKLFHELCMLYIPRTHNPTYLLQ